MMDIWDKFPEKNKAWFEVEHILPFENILDIDDKGDDWAEIPHIYTTAFHPENGPFRPHVSISLETIERYARRYGQSQDDKRVEKFPREPSQEGSWISETLLPLASCHIRPTGLAL